MTVLLLHPGLMGASIGKSLRMAGPDAPVMWVSELRSSETHARAEAADLTAVPNLAAGIEMASVVISVCPPAAAVEQAATVKALGFDGIYVDMNAIAPATTRAIAGDFDHFVDGGIVGPPVKSAGTTRLYLSGDGASQVGALFDGSWLEVRVVGGGVGAASALKMSFAAWTKGTSALLLAIRALADVEGVTEALMAEWETSMPELVARSERTPAVVGPKAWRFEAEMEEIADTFAAADLPDGFHRAAAEIYGRLASLKGRPHGGDESPTIEDVVALLLSDR